MECAARIPGPQTVFGPQSGCTAGSASEPMAVISPCSVQNPWKNLDAGLRGHGDRSAVG
jgi:hypothetical protein